MFDKWRGQRTEFYLDAQESKAFLNNPVNVSKIYRHKTVPGGVQITFTNDPPMSRLGFLRGFAVWAAIALAGAVIYAPNIMQAGREAVVEAVTALENKFPTAESFNLAYWGYVFDCNEQHLGYYAKDTPVLGRFKVRSACSR